MSQKYSIIAKEYLLELDRKDPGYPHKMVTWGNIQMMEDLFRLFGGDRKALFERTGCFGHHFRFKFVMDKLDRESKQSGAIFKKGFIHYSGIINRPTRCFTLNQTEGHMNEPNTL